MSNKSGKARHHTTLFAVDRRERNMIVVIDDDGRPYEVEAKAVPEDCRAEGAVLRVVIGAQGAPQWKTAMRDKSEERRRLDEMQGRVDALKNRDRGGDVEL